MSNRVNRGDSRGYLPGQRGYNPDTQYTPQTNTNMPKPPKWKFIYNFFGNKWKAKYANYQNDLNWWRELNEREYNTPENQMTRYREAGLNDNLIYGQGNPGNASNSPEAVAPDIDTGKPLKIAQFLIGAIATGANIRNIASITRFNNIKAITEAKRQGLLDQDIAKRTTENEILSRSADNQVQKTVLENQVLEQRKQLNTEELKILNKKAALLDYDKEYQEWLKSMRAMNILPGDQLLRRQAFILLYKGINEVKGWQEDKKQMEEYYKEWEEGKPFEGLTVPDEW